MRERRHSRGLSVNAIAGTNVVILGMDLERRRCAGLRGFAIHRTDHTEDEAYWLEGMRTFAETDPGLRPGSKVSTRRHPIQDFSWSDYTAKPGHDYTYRVLALEGPPARLAPRAEVEVRVQTESPTGGSHDVYFNRGAAASQEFARRFGNRKPGSREGAADPAWTWLSRGAHEAIVDFIGRARGPRAALRVCAYEFRLASVLRAFAEAKARRVDVDVLYDGGKEFPRDENRAAVAEARIRTLCQERVPKPQAIAHNKFIVLIESGRPQAVLTGSTNFSEGGVYGQANVVHVVEDRAVAAAYLDYWKLLAANPHRRELAAEISDGRPPPAGLPRKGTSAIFSPRGSLDALEYYGRLAEGARDALFMTFAFGMHPRFQQAYRAGRAPLRYALFEKLLGPGVRKEKRAAAARQMIALRRMPANRFAVGSQISLNLFDRWLGEKLTGLNTHVKYVHTKFMLIDPLGQDPLLVTGSANFSAASTNKNDENMLVVRGDRRVADVYLGEYMRLWDHYAFREWASRQPPDAAAKPWPLDPTDAWLARHLGNGALSRHRAYFAG